MKKSQTATEYLIVLAVIIIIALIVVVVMGGFGKTPSEINGALDNYCKAKGYIGVMEYEYDDEAKVYDTMCGNENNQGFFVVHENELETYR